MFQDVLFDLKWNFPCHQRHFYSTTTTSRTLLLMEVSKNEERVGNLCNLQGREERMKSVEHCQASTRERKIAPRTTADEQL